MEEGIPLYSPSRPVSLDKGSIRFIQEAPSFEEKLPQPRGLAGGVIIPRWVFRDCGSLSTGYRISLAASLSTGCTLSPFVFFVADRKKVVKDGSSAVYTSNPVRCSS